MEANERTITIRKLAIKLSVKTFKTRTVHFVFSLRIFVSVHVIITLRYYKVVSSSFNFTLDFGFDFGLGVKYLNVL